MPRDQEFILTLSCKDQTGIVYAVSGLLFQAGCNIIDSQQFGDVDGDDATGLFFMRVHFAAPPNLADAAMLDNLFRAQISDPLLRAAAVQAYMQQAGLPPSLASSINFFSNRYSLQKQLSASVAWQLARTTSMFSLYKSRREMLSSQQVDNSLLGSSLAIYNDNTEQAGAMVSVSYRPGAQTVVTLTGNAINVKSLAATQTNHHRDVRLNLARTYSPRVTGSVELRHVKGSAGLGGQQYTENAVTAVLTSKF